MANCNRQQLNITCGTDVVLHDRLIFEGETFDPNLSTGIAANLVSSMGKRTTLEVEVVDDELLITIPWVEGRLPGCYGLEVTGSCNSRKWSTYADGLIKYTKATRIGASEVTVESDSYDITQEVGYRYAEGGNINDVQVNGTSVVQAGKAKIIMPTKVGDLPNDRGYQNAQQVQQAIERNLVPNAEVTVDNNVGTPSANVTKRGNTLRFDFRNLKGEPFTFDDLTPGQKAEITGPKGNDGESAIFDPETGNISTMKQTTGDDTLSPMSQKAVTDALVPDKDYVDITNQFSWADNYQIIADPTNNRYGQRYASTTGRKASNYVDISAYSVIKIKMLAAHLADSTGGLVFYDADLEPVEGHFIAGQSEDGVEIRTYVLPANAKYVRATYWIDEVTYGVFYCKGTISKENIEERLHNVETATDTYNITALFSWAANYQIIADASNNNFGNRFASTTGRKASDFVDISRFATLNIAMLSAQPANSTGGLVFYDGNQNPIEGQFIAGQSVNGVQMRTYAIPANAKYIRTTYWIDEETYGAFSCLASTSTLKGKTINLGDVRLSKTFINSEFEQGSIDVATGQENDSSVETYNFRIRTSDYIDTQNSSYIRTTVNSEFSIDMLEYDDNYNFIKNTVYGGFNGIVKLQESTKNIKFCVYYTERSNVFDAANERQISPTDDVDLVIVGYGDKDVFGGYKKPYTSAYERFKVLVNQKPHVSFDYSDVYASNNDSERIALSQAHATDTLDDAEVLETTTGVIALPPNYSPYGDPVKLILFAHGGHGYVDETHWYPSSSTFPNLVKRLLAAGYAVFDCNGYKDTPYNDWQALVNQGNVQISEGMPQVCDAYFKCYQHIVANYNVYPKVYIWGCSQGGHLAMNFAYCHRDIVAAVAMMAGQLDLYDQGYSYQTLENKRQVAKLLGFSNTDFANNTEAMAAYEHYKADPWDPMQRIVLLNNKRYILGYNTPTKFFYGTNDTTLPQYKYTVNLVEALQNSKVICYLRWFEGFSHDDVAAGGSPIAIREAVEWFNRF